MFKGGGKGAHVCDSIPREGCYRAETQSANILWNVLSEIKEKDFVMGCVFLCINTRAIVQCCELVTVFAVVSE